MADLRPVVGSEQGGKRPVLVIQNNKGNRFSPTVIAAAITSAGEKPPLPTHIPVTAEESGLQRDSIILLEQIRTLDKTRLQAFIGVLPEARMKQVEDAIGISLGFLEGQ